MHQNRRTLLLSLAGAVVVAVVIGGYVLGVGGTVPAALAGRQGLAQRIATPSDLGDMALGNPDAPVTIVEYASMTCPHCASFHNTNFPLLKRDYIDTGKVRLVFREFPLDPVATAASMLARCAGDTRFFGFIDVLFARQSVWLGNGTNRGAMAGLQNIARQGGFNDAQYKACLEDEELLDGIAREQTRAAQEFGVNSTPTFFINGVRMLGNEPYAQFVQVIEEDLPPGEDSGPDESQQDESQQDESQQDDNRRDDGT